MMHRQAKVALENAVSDMLHISHLLQSLSPDAAASVRSELTELQRQAEAAVRHFQEFVASPPRRSSLAQRVGQAAFGANGVGLVVPQTESLP